MVHQRTILVAVAVALAPACTLVAGLDGLEFQPAAGGSSAGGGGADGGAGGSAGGDGGVGGAGGCTGVTDCPVPDNKCEQRVCIAGSCGTVPVESGTVLLEPDQVAGDCQQLLCDGQGITLSQDDDTDLPQDGTVCTEDLCTGGEPSNPPVSIGSACDDGGGTICDDAGQCVGCLVPADCTSLPPDNECQTRTCINNVCGQDFTADGTALSVQVWGNCKEQQCNGSGDTKVFIDDTDLPVDGLACTADTCTNGTPSNPNEDQGTPCGGSKVCDDQGQCVGCNVPADCGLDTTCQAHTCDGNQICGVVNAPAGTPAGAQINNDCQQLQCDGNGLQQSVADDADLPLDDGNECTDEVCNGGVPGHPNFPINAPCSAGGSYCNGLGGCVACNAPHQCAQGAPCQTASCSSNTCGLGDTPGGTPAPQSEQTSLDCTIVNCDGSGGTVPLADPTDLPDDNNECTDDVCTGTLPTNPPLAQGTSCQQGAGECDGNGACSIGAPLGGPCSLGSQCISTHCTDLVCCNEACGGSCRSCLGADTGGSDGTCGDVSSGLDPDGDCAPAACDGGGTCATCAHAWSGSYGDGNTDIATGIALDASGNALLSGYFKDTLSFGTTPLTSQSSRDVFAAKLNPAGVEQWAHRFGGNNDQMSHAIAVAPNGNLVITGEFKDELDLGGGLLPHVDDQDIFVAVLAGATGAHLWSKSFGGINDDKGFGVAVDVDGNAVITGYFRDSINFGSGAHDANGDRDLFVAKLSVDDGSEIWAKTFGGSDDDYGRGVAIDGAGHVLVTGEFEESIDFGGGSLSAQDNKPDVFVLKLNGATGAFMWANAYGDSDDDIGHDIAVDTDDNVIVTGTFRYGIDFGGGTMTSTSGSYDGFVAKLASDGSHLWSTRFGDNDEQYGYGVAADTAGNVIITGRGRGSANFGGADLPLGNYYAAFVARFDPYGNHLCSQGFGGGGGEQVGNDVATGAAGTFAICGSFRDNVDFGGGAMVSSGGDDIFAARFVP